MKKTTITVLTPTYNRAHTLERLYVSLCNQTCKKFKWLVVDDGSTDQTKELIEKWNTEGKLDIKYVWQKNQGMHVAINNACKIADTELLMWIGSDDYLPDHAIDRVVKCWERDKRDDLCGMIGLDATYSGEIIGSKFPEKLISASFDTLIKRHNMTGDKTYVYRLDILRQYPFPVIEGERHMVTSYIHDKIAQNYELLLLNEVLCHVYYSPDGISNNYWNVTRKNPNGHAMYHSMKMQIEDEFKYKYKSAANYVLCKILSGDLNFFKESPAKLITVLAIPAGLLLYITRYKIRKGQAIKPQS